MLRCSVACPLRGAIMVFLIVSTGFLASACRGTPSATPPFRTSGIEVHASEQQASFVLHHSNATLFKGPPTTLQTSGGIGFAIYRRGSEVGVCITGTSYVGCWPAPGYRSQFQWTGDTLEVVATGTGNSDEVWALVRIPASTTRLSVTIARGRSSSRVLRDGFAVVTVVNRLVGGNIYWPEYSPGFDVGTVTGFNDQGLVTGSDQVRVCSDVATKCPTTAGHSG
jgi:hypothetical protein